MSRRTIILVITLAIISLGIVIAGQVFWVRKAYALQEEQFNRRAFVAISEVVQTIRTMNRDSAATEPVRQVSNNYFIANINDTPQPYLLENLLKDEFRKSQLLEDFEYGIYDCFNDSIVFGSKISFKPGKEREQAQQIHKLENFEPDGHYFGVVFPNKSSFILLQLDFWMYSSIVILLIIIFFSYTVYIILQQKRLSEIRTDFVNNMTHELKTPISTIGLSADAIEGALANPSPDRIRQYVQIIKNENNRLKNQVERVLQIAALSPKKVGLQNSTIDMHSIILTAAENFRMQTLEQEGTLETRLDATSYHVKGDLVHITNVIYNLIDNAVKYTEESPRILIHTSSSAGWLRIDITDNGIGISKINQKMIFEKFYRVPTGNLHSVRGYGLGLFYVKTIIKAHGGKIKLESEPGKGSTFTLELRTTE
jgi:two-component system, OmpR family, phosphate regulon sensor histidine kinase PhoR